MTTIANTIITLIESGKTEEALTKLVEVCKEVKPNILNEAIVIKSACEENNKKYHSGLITHSEWQLRRNNINFSILSLLGTESKTSTEPQVVVKKKKITNYGIIIGLSVFILAISYYFYYRGNSDRPKGGNVDIQNTIVDNLGLKIYPDYKDVYLKGVDSKKTPTIEKTKSLIQIISLSNNSTLDLSDRIYREVALMVSYKILSLLSENMSEKNDYSTRGISASSNAKLLIQSINTLQDIQEAEEIQSWVFEERHESRILVNDFILKCINYQSKGQTTREQVIQAFNSLPSKTFLQEEGYNEYPIIKWFYHEFKVK